MKDLNTKFAEEIARIKEPTYFLGLARLLGVGLMGDEKPRDFGDVCADVFQKFSTLSRHVRREILKMLRDANREEKDNGDRTQNTQTQLSNEKV